MIHTFETRLRGVPEQQSLLDAYCAEWSRGLRVAYAAVNRGEVQPPLYRRLVAGSASISSARKLVSGRMSPLTLAASSASMYC